ncbi:MAG: hypothetical protein R6U61_02195 [Thermoplasmata archaeon]
MKLYIELYFDSDGSDPMTVIKKMRSLGFEPVVGEYDFAKEYETPEDYRELVETIARALRGTGVRFRLITRRK